jgi:hypothetical protein
MKTKESKCYTVRFRCQHDTVLLHTVRNCIPFSFDVVSTGDVAETSNLVLVRTFHPTEMWWYKRSRCRQNSSHRTVR